MTTKEKALELFHKYARLWHASPADVKQCATIAVDEILDVLGDVGVYSLLTKKLQPIGKMSRLKLKGCSIATNVSGLVAVGDL